MNTRIYNLLNIFSANDRFIEPDSLCNTKQTEPVFNKAAVDGLRQESYDFLKDALM